MVSFLLSKHRVVTLVASKNWLDSTVLIRLSHGWWKRWCCIGVHEFGLSETLPFCAVYLICVRHCTASSCCAMGRRRSSMRVKVQRFQNQLNQIKNRKRIDRGMAQNQSITDQTDHVSKIIFQWGAPLVHFDLKYQLGNLFLNANLFLPL